ncbi:MAG: RNA polymerase factor sigma-32 [Alphaproteobacteria bacterium]|nr:RNA polymerase factor sigma-32 [Alphaproteobacteria bacterium]
MNAHAGLEDLRQLLAAARRAPVLTAEDERDLALRWQDGDRGAGDQLAESHLRLVIKAAFGLKGYGLPLADLIAEGNVGLLQALQRFDPARELRFSTYALWWIRAAMMEYVLKHSAPVSFGLSAERKRLFFKLRGIKSRLVGGRGGMLTPEQTAEVARKLDVGAERVTEMERLLSARSRSLDEPVGESGQSFGELLVDETPDAEAQLAERQQREQWRRLFGTAWEVLSERERGIVAARRLREEPLRLEDLAQRYGISRERVRQIEGAAIEKLKRLVRPTPAATA